MSGEAKPIAITLECSKCTAEPNAKCNEECKAVKSKCFKVTTKTERKELEKMIRDFVGKVLGRTLEDNDSLMFEEKGQNGEDSVSIDWLLLAESTNKTFCVKVTRSKPKAISTLIESSKTRSGKSYSEQYMQKANISTSNERDLRIAITTYNIVTPNSFQDYQSFFAYFNQNVETSGNVPKYVWDHRDEVSFTAEILGHIQQHLLPNGYLCRGDYKLCEVMVPCHPNIHFYGRLDGIVCSSDNDYSWPYIGIELKCKIGNKIRSQSILEFMGLIIQSRYPILHLETDMDSFKFMIHKENEATKFVSYQTGSYEQAKAIIVNWIYYANDYFNRHENILLTEVNCIKKFSYQVSQSIKTPTSYVIDSAFIKKAKTKFDDGSEKLKKLKNLEKDYNDCKALKKLEFVSVKNRTGPVCKFQHENKLIVMKMCHFLAMDDKGNKIIDELEKESDVYEILKCFPDGPWPKLCYSGYIFNTNYYTIVTEFIEGRPPDSTSQVDFNKCLESLNELHKVGISHGDPRPPNFIIETSSQKAYILDFGFSQFLGKLDESKKEHDIEIMKGVFKIDIN